MQLQELKKLVDFNVKGELVATSFPNGWVLALVHKRKSDDTSHALETARGGARVFKTLDAVAKLVNTELGGRVFSVV